jgi:hypothetical protein
MDHFTNIKVKGVSDGCGRKNYIITNTDDGSEHVAIKRETGSKYDIGEHTCLTLRQCKVLVSENRVRHFADSREEMVVDAVEDKSERKPETWDCCDPCALLILLADTTDPEVRRTLDAYGWITQDGELDDEQANDNYERWSK